LKERDRFGKIGLAEGGDRWERVWSNLPLIPMLMGYPPIRSPGNVSKIMGALQRGYLKTTLSNHHLGKYPNLIKDIQIVRPNQV